MRFNLEYKLSIEYKYKLISINISFYIIEKLLLFSYRIILSIESKIYNIISIIYLRSFKDIIDNIHPFLIEINRKKEYIIKYINNK
jgi:hypothetical protein